jgi:hypothetical protein
MPEISRDGRPGCRHEDAVGRREGKTNQRPPARMARKEKVKIRGKKTVRRRRRRSRRRGG